MARLKLTSAQVKELKKVKASPTTQTELTALGDKWGYTYHQLYNKWTYIRKGTTKKESVKKKLAVIDNSGSSDTLNRIVPYKLEKNVNLIVKTSQDDKLEVLRKLKPELLKMGVRKETLPIYNADVYVMRKVFNDDELKDRSFGITTIKDNPKMARVYRKS